MKKITLCGSTKFKDEFLKINKQLSLLGYVVYSVAFFGHADNDPLTIEQKKLLDEVHKAKIDNSDMIFVIDVDGYIGESTNSEIQHAKETGKTVHYLSQETLISITTLKTNPFLCFGRKPHAMDFEDQEEFHLRLSNYNQWQSDHTKILNTL